MTDYKPNSHKYREEAKEKKKIEKVVSGTVKTRKKNELHKLADIFISEDVSNVKSYIVMDVLVPSIKKAISDIVRNGIDMILYGGRGGGGNSTVSKISYRNYSKDYDNRGSYDSNKSRNGYSFDDVVLETRGEAEEVLLRMDEIIKEYGTVSVADLYDLIGKTGSYTNYKYGWTNIRNAEPVRVRDGYLLKLPKALPI